MQKHIRDLRKHIRLRALDLTKRSMLDVHRDPNYASAMG